jgi:outer membrane biogenesis lipoprotein LolB
MNAAQSPELQLKIQAWRAKAREGTLTKEEQMEIIKELRAGRGSVEQATSGSKVKKATGAKKVAASADDLLAELDGL